MSEVAGQMGELAPPRPKKRLGQHFLINPTVSIRMVGLLNIAKGDQILEIGPGPGALTKELRPMSFRKLLLLEKDPWWATERRKDGDDRVRIINMDALLFPWMKLPGKWKITGNLPYNIASPLIWDLVSQCPAMRLGVFMVQREVGERIRANPGSRAYGALSVWVQCHARTRLNFNVGPGNFRPAPKVESSVITIEALPEEALPAHPRELQEILKICFQKRRKQLAGILKGALLEFLLPELPRLGADERMRPEELAPETFQALAAIMANAKKTQSPFF